MHTLPDSQSTGRRVKCAPDSQAASACRHSRLKREPRKVANTDAMACDVASRAERLRFRRVVSAKVTQHFLFVTACGRTSSSSVLRAQFLIVQLKSIYVGCAPECAPLVRNFHIGRLQRRCAFRCAPYLAERDREEFASDFDALASRAERLRFRHVLTTKPIQRVSFAITSGGTSSSSALRATTQQIFRGHSHRGLGRTVCGDQKVGRLGQT